jgi:hypothetical protein
MRYSTIIANYCERHGIVVPPGFGRHPASRYAVILASSPPRLVALTWFKQEDVVHYLRKLAESEVMAVLDFKEQVYLLDSGGKRLQRGESFTP